MQTRTREYLEDANSGAYQWSDVIVKRYLNDAARDFAMQTRCIKKRSGALAESATTPDNSTYTLPSDFYELEGDFVTNDGLSLWLTTAANLPESWEADTGTPTHAILGDQIGDEIRVWPYPAAALTALKVWYTAVPPAMANDTDPATGIPGAFHQALVYFAVAACYRRNFEDGDVRKSQEFMALYARELETCLASTTRRRTSGAVTVPYREI